MKRFSLNSMWYCCKFYYIIPTIKFCKFDYGAALWTIDVLWLRWMLTFARLRKKDLKPFLLAHGFVDKGDVLIRYSSPRIGWKPADGTLIVGYLEWPEKVTSIEQLERIIDL